MCNKSNRGTKETVGSKIEKLAYADINTGEIKQGDFITENKEVIIGVDNRGWYTCDLLKGKKAYDDCSAFASEVIWLFIQNNEIGNFKAYSSPGYCGTGAFMKTKEELKDDKSKESMPVYKLEKYGFKQYTAEMIKDDSRFKLQPGDLLCTTGHVEFYKGEKGSNSFGWGDVHNSYYNYHGYEFIAQSDGSFREYADRGRYYNVIYRYEGIK